MAQHHPAVLATAVALPVALAVGVVVAAVLAQRSPAVEPVALTTVDAPDAGGPACASLLAAVPESVAGAARVELAVPAPVGAAAWRPTDGPADPYVLRCGIPRPAEFDLAAPLVVVDDVQWLEISGADASVAATTWVAVDRPSYVALTLPEGSGAGALQDVSAAITSVLPQHDLDPAPIG